MDYWNGSIPWISAKSLKDFFIHDSDDKVTELGAQNGTRLVPKDTILFIVRGMSLKTEFRMGITTRPVTFNQDLKALVASEDVLPAFLAYAIKAKTEEILGLVGEAGHGTGVLPTDRIQALQIPVPDLPIQKAIADIVGTLDEKIELNRRTNETLEKMARALFKTWFVDFDPVHAKARGEKPFGMDDATAALFPSSFEGSELGIIPTGWLCRTVEETVDAVFDGPHATPKPADEGPVFLGIKNLTGTRLDLTSIRHIAEKDWARWTKRVVPTAGDIVFCYEARLGDFALLPPGLRCCLGRRMALIRPSEAAKNRHYLFHYFTAPPFQQHLRDHVNPGSTVDRILLTEFPSYPVLIPSDATLARFEESTSAIWQGIHRTENESATLSALRDALLPQLLSGNLEVKDAEKIVGQVA